MVQRLIGFVFASAAALLIIYAAVRISQRTDDELSPVRRAMVLGGIAGVAVFLGVVAWWAWISPP